MELAIDTSTRFAGLALSEGGNTLVELTWKSEQNHSVELLPRIDSILRQLDTSISKLSRIVVARGPGSFSALRVGIAAARGLAMPMDIPLVAVDTLRVEAFPYLGLGLPVYAMIDAGRGQVAVARYFGYGEGGDGRPEPWLDTVEELMASLEGEAIFCGEASVSAGSRMVEDGGKIRWVSASHPTRRPGVLAYLGAQSGREDEITGTAPLEPIYLRGPSITKSKRWKL